MKLKHTYWYFKKALSKKFCEDLIRYGGEQQDRLARTGAFQDEVNLTKKQEKDLKKQRDSNVVWVGDHWIYQHIIPYINTANKSAGWNFTFNASETCQFTKYSPGQFYGWHQDSFDKPWDKPDDPNKHNKIRKLSVTCSLSDPRSYQGGDLEFYSEHPERSKKHNIMKCTEIYDQGSIVVFPSFVWHRVMPVTSGTRYSLVIWNIGEEFK
jgi:PKHD-type hydroxylase